MSGTKLGDGEIVGIVIGIVAVVTIVIVIIFLLKSRKPNVAAMPQPSEVEDRMAEGVEATGEIQLDNVAVAEAVDNNDINAGRNQSSLLSEILNELHLEHFDLQ